ncbi:MAG: gliding motility-associated C-terminal domain-containing protein [Cytophagales bacterium]|nr:gliding motility-associated C-terminal domain-containing protein [Cytophagales bacterium]
MIFSQDLELIGLLDGQLVTIDSLTGQATVYRTPSGPANLADLTYHESNDAFYSLRNTSNEPSLIRISVDGEFEEIGSLTINGNQIPLAEALAYYPEQEKLYAAVSLNGGTSDNDFYSESIVEVDTNTGECIFITEISTNQTNPDIDVMTFSGDDLYLADGAPPSANFLSIYRLNFQSVGVLSNPVVTYESSYLPIRDFTVIGSSIYFTEERKLYKYSTISNTIQLIGTTHSQSDFSGEIIQGISKFESCFLPFLDLGEDQVVCDRQSLLLDATNSNATYTWQDGSSASTFLVTSSGTYSVRVDNACGLTVDTVKVDFLDTPIVDLGEDQTLCDTNTVELELTAVPGTYTWQDGSESPRYEVSQPGNYWVLVENACGSDSDTVRIDYLDTPTLNLGEDQTLCNGSSLVLDVSSVQGNYRWIDGSDDFLFEVTQSGTYWLEVENFCGTAKDSIEIVYDDLLVSSIPNVFTPNGDGVNDYFFIDSRLMNTSLQVFQRTGHKVYESTNYQNDWDGSNLPSGTYYWSLSNTCGHYKGSVTILY